MELEWDAGKAAQNLKKHGVSFEEAALIFYDSGRIESYDGREDYGEDRWITIGRAYSALLYLVYTVRTKTLFALFLRGKLMSKKESNIVRRTVNLNQPPLLSADQKERLDALAAMPDSQIDYSDAPSLPDALWRKAAAHRPRTKQQITLRLDMEVLEFFRHTGKQYQSRINAVLRSYVDEHKR